MTSSEIWARANNMKCEGEMECHWCGAPCKRLWRHGQPPPMPFTKRTYFAKRANANYICSGCWSFRRARVTIRCLDGSFIDGQCAENYSWLIKEDGCFYVPVTKDSNPLYPILLDNPPLRFSLMLMEKGKAKNMLQFGVVNDLTTIQADTELAFTINNIPHTYTVYELDEALKHGPEGKSPGTQALIRFLGEYKPDYWLNGNGKDEKKERGRPRKEDMIDGRITKRNVKKGEK